MEFNRVLEELLAFLERNQIPHALAGAFALHAHGISRATADLDVVIADSGRAALLAFVASRGYTCLHASDGYSNHVHPDARQGRLDFIYVDAQTGGVLFRDARPLSVGGRLVPVPRPEHLIAMKLLALTNDPSRTYQDLADIQALLALPGVDVERVRGYFDRHGLGWRLDELLRAR